MRIDVLTTAHGGTPRIPRRRRAIKEWSDVFHSPEVVAHKRHNQAKLPGSTTGPRLQCSARSTMACPLLPEHGAGGGDAVSVFEFASESS
jgi:hypothetical protein